MSGLFITLEGVDGAGKSSHTEWLINYFQQKNKEVLLTREPGGTELGEQLRNILLNESMSQTTEVLLMFAARQESVDNIIKPALIENKVVISDRFTDSTFAYQGGGRAYDIYRLQQLATWVHADVNPHLTFLFDVPLEVARQRLSATRTMDRFEKEEETFFMNVRKMYLQLAQQQAERFVIIDATQSIETIRHYLKTVLDKRFAL
ncbi:dTMP kinase [Pelistega sp. NLN82]|uniref:Thymidylate kinase n=1 Tax=Pelistega ratti TaxID=2652177 RepID=A0A6L9Y420_9BURK|nr:dTMP kinase [Pelistega ratti]NEN75141.1 dTMP kinase [Pelistega ratti]